MGNLDLIIIINGRPILIKGTDYNDRDNAIKIVMDKWHKQQQHTREICDFPEEIDNEIRSIKIYETDLTPNKND